MTPDAGVSDSAEKERGTLRMALTQADSFGQSAQRLTEAPSFSLQAPSQWRRAALSEPAPPGDIAGDALDANGAAARIRLGPTTPPGFLKNNPTVAVDSVDPISLEKLGDILRHDGQPDDDRPRIVTAVCNRAGRATWYVPEAIDAWVATAASAAPTAADAEDFRFSNPLTREASGRADVHYFAALSPNRNSLVYLCSDLELTHYASCAAGRLGRHIIQAASQANPETILLAGALDERSRWQQIVSEAPKPDSVARLLQPQTVRRAVLLAISCGATRAAKALSSLPLMRDAGAAALYEAAAVAVIYNDRTLLKWFRKRLGGSFNVNQVITHPLLPEEKTTLLMQAAGCGSGSMIELLRQWGANINQDVHGVTALDYAHTNHIENPAILRALSGGALGSQEAS